MIGIATTNYVDSKNIKMPVKISSVEQLNKRDTFTFVLTTKLTVGGIVLNNWTTGIIINETGYSFDSIMLSVNPSNDLIIGYKNNDVWILRKI